MKSKIIEWWESKFEDGKNPMSHQGYFWMTLIVFGLLGLMLASVGGLLHLVITSKGITPWLAPLGAYPVLAIYVLGLAELAIRWIASLPYISTVRRLLGLSKESLAKRNIQKQMLRIEKRFQELWKEGLQKSKIEPYFVGSNCELSKELIQEICEENFRDQLGVKILPADTSVSVLHTEKLATDDFMVIARLNRKKCQQQENGSSKHSFNCTNAVFRLGVIRDPKGDVITSDLIKSYPAEANLKQIIAISRDTITMQLRSNQVIDSVYDDAPLPAPKAMKPVEAPVSANHTQTVQRIAAT